MLSTNTGFPAGTSFQETQKMQVRSLGWEDPLEEEMTTHSSILAWEVPWTEAPGRSQRVRHVWTGLLKNQNLLDVKHWNVTHVQEERQSTEINLEMTQVMELASKDQLLEIHSNT